MFKKLLTKELGIFAGGFAAASAGLAMLKSRPARKVYAHLAAAGLLARDSIMENVEKAQAAASDIMADAEVIKEAYNQEPDPDSFDDMDDFCEEPQAAEEA